MQSKVTRKAERDKKPVWCAPVLKDVQCDPGNDYDSDTESSNSSSDDDDLPILPKLATKAHKLAKQIYPAHGAGRRKETAKMKKAAKVKAAKERKAKKNRNK